MATDIWLTNVGSRSQLHRRGNNFRAIARLKANVSVEQAQTEMTTISERLGQQYPDTNKDVRVIVASLQREMVGDVESMLYLLLGAVALVPHDWVCDDGDAVAGERHGTGSGDRGASLALGASHSRIVRSCWSRPPFRRLAPGSSAC